MNQSNQHTENNNQTDNIKSAGYAMNLLNLNSQQTMSSLEISELVESRHDKVKQSIERLAERSVIELPPLGEIKTATKPVAVYYVCKRDSYIIVAQLSPEFTAKLVDRWQELEAKQAMAFVMPKTFAEALRLAADTQEQLDAAQARIEADKPKVEFAMNVRNMQGACAVGDFAKTIGHGRNKFFKMMRDDLILMKNNIPYQRYIDMGCFIVIEQIPYTDSKGKTHPAFTTMVTGKGQVFLEKKYRKERRNGLVLLQGALSV